MFYKLITMTAACLLIGAGPVFADNADEPLKMSLQAQTVTVSEDGKETFGAADAVLPGAIIEYRLTYENVSDAVLDGFVIKGKIPEVTVFIDDTAQSNSEAIFEARIEDIGWTLLPAMRYVPDETGVMHGVRVPPEDYAEVRWRLIEPLEPGAKVEKRYRVAVND